MSDLSRTLHSSLLHGPACGPVVAVVIRVALLLLPSSLSYYHDDLTLLLPHWWPCPLLLSRTLHVEPTIILEMVNIPHSL